MVDKQREIMILKSIYSMEEFEIVEYSESPDVTLKNKGIESSFGIEITEFYYSESNARLQNIPGYFSDIIDRQEYRHKQDRNNLKPVEVEIKTKDGIGKGKAQAIIQEIPDFSLFTE